MEITIKILNYLWITTLLIILLLKKFKIKNKITKTVIICNLFISLLIGKNYVPEEILQNNTNINNEINNILNVNNNIDLSNIPEYKDNSFIVINNNKPYFKEEDLTTQSYENYSKLDYLGRCGPAMANISIDLMPTEPRKSIGSVKPTGWQTTKYNNVDGKYLYNRAHLIGYQLTGENANKENLITGTRYLNIEGMLPFENMIADYIKETKNHVLYRVTPIFKDDELLARGVLLEARSIEDKGKGIEFNVYSYNVQPGINIDYSTGKSSKAN